MRRLKSSHGQSVICRGNKVSRKGSLLAEFTKTVIDNSENTCMKLAAEISKQNEKAYYLQLLSFCKISPIIALIAVDGGICKSRAIHGSFTDLDLTQNSGQLHESVFSLSLVGLRLTRFSCCSQLLCLWHVGATCYNLWVRVSSCELHLTIFHTHVQYVCVIRKVHVLYTDQLSMRVYHKSYYQLKLFSIF